MAEGIRISELGEVNSLQDGCCFPVISEIDGRMQNVKIKKQKLAAQLLDQFNAAMNPRFSQLQSSISQVDNKNDYSQGPAVIGKWFDGRPVYRRVFQWGNGYETTTEEWFEHRDDDGDLEYIETITHHYRNIDFSDCDFLIDGMRTFRQTNFRVEIYEYNNHTGATTQHTNIDDYLILTYVPQPQ